MIWAVEVALAEDGVVRERGLGLPASSCEGVVELMPRTHDAHAPTTAARRGLDDERKADVLRIALRKGRDARGGGDPFGCELVSTEAERLRGRSDPREPCLDRRGRERRAFGEEAVARMDGVGVGLACRADVFRGVEVARDHGREVGRPGVERAEIVRRHDRHRLDVAGTAGAEDAKRDLAPVRDEQPADHWRFTRSQLDQSGRRRSRKARRPSWPSPLVRRSAMRRPVSGPSGRSRTRRFA